MQFQVALCSVLRSLRGRMSVQPTSHIHVKENFNKLTFVLFLVDYHLFALFSVSPFGSTLKAVAMLVESYHLCFFGLLYVEFVYLDC